MKNPKILSAEFDVECPSCGSEETYDFGSEWLDGVDLEEECQDCGLVLCFAVTVDVTCRVVYQ